MFRTRQETYIKVFMLKMKLVNGPDGKLFSDPIVFSDEYSKLAQWYDNQINKQGQPVGGSFFLPDSILFGYDPINTKNICVTDQELIDNNGGIYPEWVSIESLIAIASRTKFIGHVDNDVYNLPY